MEVNRILELYKQLPPDEKEVVEVLAYACCPVYKNSLRDLFRFWGSSKTQMDGLFRKLKNSSFVICQNAFWEEIYSLPASYSLEVLIHLVKEGRDLSKEFQDKNFWLRTNVIGGNIREVLLRFFKDGKITNLSSIGRNSEFVDEMLLAILLSDKCEGLERVFSEEALLMCFQGVVFSKINFNNSNVDIGRLYCRCAKTYLENVSFQRDLRDAMCMVDLFEGRLKEIVGQASSQTEDGCYVNGMLALYEGEYALSVKYFEQGLKIEKMINRNVMPLSPFFNFGYAMALVLSNDSRHLKKISVLYGKKSLVEDSSYIVAWVLFSIKLGVREDQIQLFVEKHQDMLDMDIIALLLCVIKEYFGFKWMLCGESLLARLAKQGHGDRLIELECKSVIPGLREEYEELEKELGVPGLVSRIKVVAEWETVLNLLLSSQGAEKTNKNVEKRARVVYIINTNNYFIQPVLQQSKDGVSWTSGRNIALKRMAAGEVEGMTNVDRLVAQCIRNFPHYSSEQYELNHLEALTHLVGHPYLFLNSNPSIFVEVAEMFPELTLTRGKYGYMMCSNVKSTELLVQVIRETNTRLLVLKLTTRQKNVLDTFQRLSSFPFDAEEKLLILLKQLNGVLTIHSDLFEKDNTLKTLKSDSRVVVQLLPVGEVLRVELFVKPFSSAPPYCKAGVGAKSVIGMLNGERCQAIRDMSEEESCLKEIVPDLEKTSTSEEGKYSYLYASPENCLELLDLLSQRGESVVTEWPEGVKYKVKGVVGCGNFNIALKAKNQWFEVEGEVKMNDAVLMTIKELMEGMKVSHGRFVPLGNGDFVALSDSLRKRLADLESVVSLDKGVLKVQQFATSIFDDWKEEGIQIHTDRRFSELRKRIDRANAMDFPVPITLRADLREYQVAGFEWLARLGEWGAGGCLADDMGLGKTVQTIAVLLRLAKEGPALVICPASVLPNWKREVERFAPSLRVHTLNMVEDREKVVSAAEAFDVILSTYGLLVTEEKMLTAREWRSVVLDEAHTIKNRDTKMSKSAMCLQAKFRLILTGTPVQNHLGEIWNLFQFINPGLLGSLDSFTERYVIPIVQYKDKGKQKRLKQLLSPFLLRRTKSAVLDELPSKTEVLMEVALSEPELAAYELLRRRAEQLLSESAPGEQIKMLAEITRLRMAACNINLVSDLTMVSSKMETFLSITDDLKESHHRALVFSQFTSHLSLIRQELDHREIPYLYLDGSTPIHQREKLVAEFQTGDTLLFLVSLKAGGLGLNLTAADFVIHMDPWWNPAIEDQATDRAHRIGQVNPVTVYRLIAKGTIEEKILRLHQTKKDMADSLLEGTDIAKGLSREDLLDLLKDN